MRPLPIFCRMLRILGNGLVDKWKMMHWPRVQECEKQSGVQPMGMEDVQGALFIFSALLLLSCLGLTAENLLHKYCRPNKWQNRKTNRLYRDFTEEQYFNSSKYLLVTKYIDTNTTIRSDKNKLTLKVKKSNIALIHFIKN